LKKADAPFEGVEVLADDERLARLHFERAGKRGWSDW
jgi:hypothetical protein